MRFAAGETEKHFRVFIFDDVYVEGAETAQLTLSNPQGVSLGAQSTATLTIVDNDFVAGSPNPIDGADYFIRTQYVDFLYREPDSIGFQNWLNTLNGCPNGGFGNNPECDRVKVSLGFYFSAEFGERGFWIVRFYEGVLGVRAEYRPFMRDLQRIGGQLSPQESEAAKQEYSTDFLARPEFLAIYAGLLDAAHAAEFVSKLEQTAGVTLANRNTLIGQMQSGQKTAAETLRAFVESPEVNNKFPMQGLVTMMYFGYLRRDPDPIGYNNWLQTLQQTGDIRHLVFGFLYSTEYRKRFGPF